MNIYKRRWINALKIAAKINRYLKKGYLVFDNDGEIFNGKFVINENQLETVEKSTYGSYHAGYFHNDKKWDNGIYTTIKDYNKIFENFKVVHPKDMKKLC